MKLNKSALCFSFKLMSIIELCTLPYNKNPTQNISYLYREKESLKNEMEVLNQKVEKFKKDLINSEKEKQDISLRYDNFKKDYYNLENAKAKIEKEMIEMATERDTYRKTNSNLTDRFSELQAKISSLEMSILRFTSAIKVG